MNRLLFVFGVVGASGIDGERRRTCDGGGIFRFYVEALAERGNRRCHCALGEVLVVDVCDIVRAESARAERGIEILTAKLDVENLAIVMIGFFQLAISREVLLIILRVCDALQIAANDGRGLVMLGDSNSIETFCAVGHINIAAHEIQQVGALKQYLRHPGVVVVAIRDVTIVAAFRFLSANRVWDKCAERSAAQALGGNRLLRVVNPVAILILRADENRARGANRGDTMAGYGAVDAEHEAVVTKHLEIISRPVARVQAFVVQHRFALVRHHREMAAKTIRRPRSVAGVASHTAIGVRELR